MKIDTEICPVLEIGTHIEDKLCIKLNIYLYLLFTLASRDTDPEKQQPCCVRDQGRGNLVFRLSAGFWRHCVLSGGGGC